MSPAANRSRRVATPVLMRSLLVLGFVLAIGAIGVAVLSGDVLLLKLAALLGVWAALATAFPVVYFRRTARAAEQKTEESKRTYEMELHREISARREYEIGVSAAVREDAEARHRDELAGLREQLDRLNTTLSGLLDGDLLFERLTLSAESTRVRQVGGDSGRGRLAGMARAGQIEGIPEPTGPYVGQQSGAPVSVGPGAGSAFGTYGAPHPYREDDTVQFPRGTFGPGPANQAGAPVAPAVAQAPVMGAPQDDPPAPVVASPYTRVSAPPAVAESVVAAEVVTVIAEEPEPVVEATAEPEPVVEATVEPEPEPEPEPEAEPALEAEPEAEPELESEPEPELESELELVPAEVTAEPAAFTEPVAEENHPPEPSDPGTAHSAGISVADLLAAYGASEGAPRRRRRAGD